MSKSVLNNSQKRDLIAKYENEVIKLQFQMEQMSRILTDLKENNDVEDSNTTAKGKVSKTKTNSTASIEPKRRGRPAKVKTEATVSSEPKRRGRPAKVKTEVATSSEPKRRGRPAKAKTEVAASSEPKRRGRPAKAKTEVAASSEPKRRGRPAKAKTEATASSESKRRGRPAKAKTEAAVSSESKRRGRPRKKVPVLQVSLAKELKNNAKAEDSSKSKRQRIVNNGYKLSEWDQFVIDALKAKQYVLITKDLIDISKEKTQKEGKTFDEDHVKNKLNRSLHKMTNKRSDLIKTKFEGKGFAYALPEWVNASTKELKRKFKRK